MCARSVGQLAQQFGLDLDLPRVVLQLRPLHQEGVFNPFAQRADLGQLHAQVVLRQDVDEIQSTGVSLMPEALEKTITVREMADLLHFLKNWRYLDGAVPLK